MTFAHGIHKSMDYIRAGNKQSGHETVWFVEYLVGAFTQGRTVSW